MLCTAAAQGPLQMRHAVNAILAANIWPRGKRPCILNSKRRSRAAFKNMAIVVHSIISGGKRRYKAQRPPKNRLNDLNKRPGKVGAFGAPFGACCANGHCEPPCT